MFIDGQPGVPPSRKQFMTESAMCLDFFKNPKFDRGASRISETLWIAGTINPDRHDDPDLLFIAPPPPTRKSKNLTAHRTPHPRHVVNDVIKHMS